MTKISTWMPLYIGDYLSDTMHLSAQEHGAYLLLIMNYWRNGPLPDDDKALASISKVERREWMREVGPIVRQFFVTQDGKLRHKRIDIELEAARENSHKKRLAAEARWAKRNTGGDPSAGPNGDARAYADASAEDPIRICPSPSPSSKEEEKEGRKKGSPKPPSVGGRSRACQEDADFAAFYAKYPRKDGVDDALKAWRSVIASGATPEQIMTGLANYKFNPDPNYIRLPAGWLRGGFWKTAPEDQVRAIEHGAAQPRPPATQRTDAAQFRNGFLAMVATDGRAEIDGVAEMENDQLRLSNARH